MNCKLLFAACCLATPLAAQTPSRTALIRRIDSIAAAPVKSGNVAGLAVAVVKGRDTLLFKGYGFADVENQVPVTPQTVFRIGSVTKQFTSSAVMQLVEQGKIGLDDELTKYIPNFPTHGQHILVRHLLNHTSGIPSYTDIGPRFGAISRLDLAPDALIAIVAPFSLLFDPGTHFYYNNTGYFMLGMILERVTGKKYGDYLAEQIFAPRGLSSTVYCDTRRIIPHRSQGYDRGPAGLRNAEFLSMDLPFAAGSLCSTVGDLVSWTAQLSSGRVVNDASYRAMTTPVKLPSGRPMTYGYGLTSDAPSGHRVISHGGGINGFVSQLMHLPDDSLIVAVLVNTTPGPADAIANAIVREVLGLPAPAAQPPPANIALTAEDRARYVGTYALTRPDGTKRELRIFEQNGELMAQMEGQAASVRLASQGAHAFTAPGLGRIAFDVTNDRATGFVTGGGARTLEGVRRQ
jgi:CubicO group peptidase (beta-lactamase class C family)